MRKVKFSHVFFSLILGIGLSTLFSLPLLKNLYREALMTTQSDVEKIYRDLNRALIQTDIISLQKLLADGFVLETSQGELLNKQTWIRNIQNGTMRYNQVSNTEVKAIGRNSAAVSAIVMGELRKDIEEWKIALHLEIVRKGKNVQIQRMAAKSICERGLDGLFDKNCQQNKRKQFLQDLLQKGA